HPKSEFSANCSVRERLNGPHGVWRDCQARAGEVLLHVLGVGGAGQRQNSYRVGEGKQDLGGSCVQARGKFTNQWMMNNFHVRGEQREALINDLALLAELSYFAVPAGAREAAVLYE